MTLYRALSLSRLEGRHSGSGSRPDVGALCPEWSNSRRIRALMGGANRPRSVDPQSFDDRMHFWQRLVDQCCRAQGNHVVSVRQLQAWFRHPELGSPSVDLLTLVVEGSADDGPAKTPAPAASDAPSGLDVLRLPVIALDELAELAERAQAQSVQRTFPGELVGRAGAAGAATAWVAGALQWTWQAGKSVTSAALSQLTGSSAGSRPGTPGATGSGRRRRRGAADDGDLDAPFVAVAPAAEAARRGAAAAVQERVARHGSHSVLGRLVDIASLGGPAGGALHALLLIIAGEALLLDPLTGGGGPRGLLLLDGAAAVDGPLPQSRQDAAAALALDRASVGLTGRLDRLAATQSQCRSRALQLARVDRPAALRCLRAAKQAAAAAARHRQLQENVDRVLGAIDDAHTNQTVHAALQAGSGSLRRLQETDDGALTVERIAEQMAELEDLMQDADDVARAMTLPSVGGAADDELLDDPELLAQLADLEREEVGSGAKVPSPASPAAEVSATKTPTAPVAEGSDPAMCELADQLSNLSVPPSAEPEPVNKCTVVERTAEPQLI